MWSWSGYNYFLNCPIQVLISAGVAFVGCKVLSPSFVYNADEVSSSGEFRQTLLRARSARLGEVEH